MWRFVQLSDLHLGSYRDGIWNNLFLCTMMPEVMVCLKEDLAKLKPDFLLATGDIASQQTRDAMFAARDFMDSLGFPYFPMGGNHDFVLKDSRQWFLDAFSKHLPVNRTYYSFTHKNLHFCVLDAWWLWSDGSLSEISEASVVAELDTTLKGARWVLPPHQIEWLRHDLTVHAKLPTIIAVHYPLIPIPARMRRPTFNDGGCLENGPLLLDFLSAFPQVKAVFSGHVHMHFVEQFNGVAQIVTGALPEFPTEYRDIHVYEDRLEIYTLGLSDPTFALRSLIPGKEWTAGKPQDRRTTVPLH